MFGDIKMDLGYIKNGEKEGLWTKWYENGQKQIEGIYKDWEKVGKWTYYNEDGSIKEVKEYPSPN